MAILMMKKIAIPQILQTIFQRDITLAIRRQSDTLGAIFFFALVVSLFPLAIGVQPKLLQQIAPGIIWVSALLSVMLSLGRLFNDDYQDGILEQLALSKCPLELIAFIKMLSHWCCSGCILLLLSPILALQFNLSDQAMTVLFLSLLIGTPTLSFIGSIGAALTIGIKSSGTLISLLILPLLIPILILGTLAVDAASANSPYSLYLYLMIAIGVLSSFFAPIACAAALRIALD
jgi:heme exporter protein B